MLASAGEWWRLMSRWLGGEVGVRVSGSYGYFGINEKNKRSNNGGTYVRW